MFILIECLSCCFGIGLCRLLGCVDLDLCLFMCLGCVVCIGLMMLVAFIVWVVVKLRIGLFWFVRGVVVCGVGWVDYVYLGFYD